MAKCTYDKISNYNNCVSQFLSAHYVTARPVGWHVSVDAIQPLAMCGPCRLCVVASCSITATTSSGTSYLSRMESTHQPSAPHSIPYHSSRPCEVNSCSPTSHPTADEEVQQLTASLLWQPLTKDGHVSGNRPFQKNNVYISQQALSINTLIRF